MSVNLAISRVNKRAGGRWPRVNKRAGKLWPFFDHVFAGPPVNSSPARFLTLEMLRSAEPSVFCLTTGPLINS